MTQSMSAPGIIRQVFDRRREKNGSYSLRAFARDIDLSPSFLSLFLNGKKNLSLNSAYRIGQRLGLDPEEQAALFNAVFNSSKMDSRTTSEKVMREEFLDALSYDSVEAKISVPESKESEARQIIEDCRSSLLKLAQDGGTSMEQGTMGARGRGIVARLSVHLQSELTQ